MGCVTTKDVVDVRQISRDKWITVRQRSLVKDTWPLLLDGPRDQEQLLGVEVFVRIFSRYPELKALFSFRDVDDDALLLQHPGFLCHSAAFIRAIGAAVDRMSDWEDQLGPLLIELGGMHATTPGFDEFNFEVFVESLIHVWSVRLGDVFHAEVRESWEILFIYLMMKLREGYHLTMAQYQGYTDATTLSEKENRIDPY